MEILYVVGFALVVAVFAVLLREERPEMALLLVLGFGVLIFILVLGKMGAVIGLFRDLSRLARVDELYLTTLLKILGIAYIAEFGAQICRDAGEGTIASKIEMVGKILILVLALPIFAAIMEVIVRLLP
ncbi:stage III sporulation protein AD [Thermacetogenium phaeum DSM 12270]|jgi:stage III sporulation protein AD|uniref:Stage III sporulation protein AD n=1 Tax=Thermacetogenium phaeum (strain ATCC BAA-254 / DSM 26808 / PB) TaxID=1089553 RepID=K4LG83_THEPS|nr:stage III sporulation protein AD [Thermacetogenium phaeum]AFV11848.1 stage III sporulation protein AD [Thermacetogenium phaeum DSM 12270]MDK2880675.1 stage sporulation protein [Clostridia bacterium]MDN5365580.1 stage sporulation protein [Thermacetogenium sp.]MDN5376145.1 stage sporulation protein [Thermacetogenium sp.]